MKPMLQRVSAFAAFICVALALFLGSNLHAAGSVTAWGYYYDLTMPEKWRPMYVPANLTSVVAVAGGYNHALALKLDGKITAWGWGGNGLTNIPVSASNIVAIFAGGLGSGYSLALRNDGRVIGWGYSGYGGETVPANLSNVIAIADHHALKADGTVVSWGGDLGGPYAAPSGLNTVISIANGLALKSEGTLVSWNPYGNILSNTPPGLARVVAIARGAGHSLALRADGQVVAWGNNTYGQTNVPAGLSNVVFIAAGNSHSLAAKSDGTVVAWGAGTNVSSPPSFIQGQSIVPAGLTNAFYVSGGRSFSLALTNDFGPPTERSPMINQTVGEGANVWMPFLVSGAGPITYQWRFAGTNITDATNYTLFLAGVQSSQAGLYSVIASNSLGVASNACQLTIVPLLLTSQPQSRSIFLGNTVSFDVETEGFNRSYHWKFNGVDFPGQTNSALVISNAQFADMGDYSVVVSNNSLMLTSAVATLRVKQVAIFGGDSGLPVDLTNAVAIDAGAHRLALRADGTVAVWGSNASGQTNVPPSATNLIAVADGEGQILALKADGTVIAWGSGPNVPSSATNVIAIAAASQHRLALKADGSIVAWGDNSRGQINIPADLTDVVAIAAGGYNSAALKANGQVVVWGGNVYGQTNVPPNLTNVVAISVGEGGNVNHLLALRTDGTVTAWGYNAGVPSSLSNAVAVSAGGVQGMALKSDGDVVTWPSPTVPSGLHNVAAIANGDMAMIGIGRPFVGPPLASQTSANGATTRIQVAATGGGPLSYQWSYNGMNLIGATDATLILTGNQSGQPGIYTVVVSNSFGMATNFCNLNVVPLLIHSQPQSQFVLMGTTVALTPSVFGEAPITYQWKREGFDLPGATNSFLVFSNVQPAHAGVYSLTASNALASLSTESATLYVSQVFQWSRGNYAVGNVPVGLTNVTQVASHNQHSIALMGDGSVRGWGLNNFGQATPPPGLSNVIALAAGEVHSLGLKMDGTVVAWGSQTSVTAGLSNVVAITSGSGHNMALKADGKVTVWATSSYGLTSVPPQATNILAIAAGDRHSLALRDDGVVVAWGANDAGQTSVPSGLSNVVAIAAGFVHSLALKSDSTVTAWGSGNYGAVAADPGLSNVVSISAGLYHSIALLKDGTVVAWGDLPDPAILDVLSNLPPVVAISGGWGFGLALIGNAPPALHAPLTNSELGALGFKTSLPTQCGRVYRLEYKNSLADTGWMALSLVSGNGKTQTLTDSATNSLRRFYRVRQW
jgi:alpha-tubulin suppressor-like RCC1 family protein